MPDSRQRAKKRRRQRYSNPRPGTGEVEALSEPDARPLKGPDMFHGLICDFRRRLGDRFAGTQALTGRAWNGAVSENTDEGLRVPTEETGPKEDRSLSGKSDILFPGRGRGGGAFGAGAVSARRSLWKFAWKS